MAKDKAKKEAAAKRAKPPKRPKRRKKDNADMAALMPGEVEAGKKKKKKAAKAVGKKRRGKRSWKLIVSLLILLIVLLIAGSATFIIMTNFLDLRDEAFDYVYTLDPREKAREKTLENRASKLTEREEEAKKRDDELDERENAIRAEKNRLTVLEIDLNNQSESLSLQEQERTPRYLQPMTEEELADIQNLSKIYSSMTTENAAAILVKLYSPQDMAAILYHMSARNAAAILAVMDVELAADLTEILLYE